MSPRAPAAVGAVLLVLAALMAAERSAAWRKATPKARPLTAPSAVAGAVVVAAFDPRPPAAAASTTHADTAETAAPPLQPGEVEICGVGIVKAGEIEQVLQGQTDFYNPEALLMAHLKRMQAHADPRTRAAALMVLRERGPLVTMAMATSDPFVYAFAQQLCLHRDAADAGSPCALLSEEQGARLDPDNGAAWMLVAEAARLRGETDNMVAALHRAAASATHEARAFLFLALALDAMPPETSETDRLRLSAALIGVQAALAVPPYLAATHHCPEARARDPERRPLCEALAEHLVSRGTLLIHAGIGRRLGERAGWSAERVERIAARNHSLFNAQLQAMMTTAGGTNSCAALRAGTRWQYDSARLGERTVAEQWLAQQNISDAQLIERYRAEMARRAAAASAPK